MFWDEYQQEIERLKRLGVSNVGAAAKVGFLMQLPEMSLHDIGVQLVSVADGGERYLWFVDWLLTELRRRDWVGSGVSQRTIS